MLKTVINLCTLVLVFVFSGCATLLPNPSEFESTKNACARGNGDECYNLGLMYREGVGTEKSSYSAKDAFKQGCQKANNEDACREFGKMESQNIGKENSQNTGIQANEKIQDNTASSLEEFEHTKNACAQGNGDMCYRLGKMYMEGLVTKKSAKNAVKVYTQGCEQKSHSTYDSCYALGKLYFSGLGVQRNYTKAKKLFEHTCTADFTKGCANLGQMYLYGNGVKQDYTQAINLLNIGCKDGDAASCSSLGTIYITGQNVKADYTKAFEMFYKACQSGDALGCYNVGNIYENGIGRAQNEKDATHFYRLACAKGLDEGCKSLEILTK